MADKVGYLGKFAKCLRIHVTLLFKSRCLDFSTAVPLPHQISIIPSVLELRVEKVGIEKSVERPSI